MISIFKHLAEQQIFGPPKKISLLPGEVAPGIGGVPLKVGEVAPGVHKLGSNDNAREAWQKGLKKAADAAIENK